MITIEQLDDLKHTVEQRSRVFLDAIEHVKQLVSSTDIASRSSDTLGTGMPERNATAKERRAKNARRSDRKPRQTAASSYKAVIEQAMRAVPSPFNVDDIKNHMKTHFDSVYHAMGASTLSGTIARMHAAGRILKSGDRNGLQAYQLQASSSLPSDTLPPKEAAYRKLRDEMNIHPKPE